MSNTLREDYEQPQAAYPDMPEQEDRSCHFCPGTHGSGVCSYHENKANRHEQFLRIRRTARRRIYGEDDEA